MTGEDSHQDNMKSILLVCDNQVDIRKIEKLVLGFSGMPCKLFRATTVSAIHEIMGKRGFGADIIILDLRLKGIGEPATALANVQETAPGLPVILLTGDEPEEIAIAVDLMTQGAASHVHRENFNVLMSTLRVWLYRQRGEEKR